MSKYKLEDLTNNELTEINIEILKKLISNMDEDIHTEYYHNYIVKKKSERFSEENFNKFKIDGLIGDWKYPFNCDHLNNELLLIVMMSSEYNIDNSEIEKLFDIYSKLNPIIKTGLTIAEMAAATKPNTRLVLDGFKMRLN